MPDLPGELMNELGASQGIRKRSVALTAMTLSWMLVELGVASYSAFSAHSPAMLAFGSDSLVETLSAATVLSQWIPGIRLSERRAARISGGLLFVLAVAILVIAVGSYLLRVEPDRTFAGLGITAAALVVMPVLARLKRREAEHTGNAALAADAVQSATCAYIAAITLLGLALRALLGLAWFDNLAALAAVPLLIREGLEAWRGNACGCC